MHAPAHELLCPDVNLPAAPVRTVLFDCDSTLSAIEGIDELAGERRDEVERLTEAAMRGEIPLEDVYGARLALIRPTRARIDALGTRYVEALVPDARETVTALRTAGIIVRVISGGILQAVARVAEAVGLTLADTAAVRLDFDSAGGYAGFDAASPLARSGGKLTVVQAWRAELARPIMFVGDGMTDLETCPAIDLFVAFAGIVERTAVTSAADLVVRARSLAPILPIALAGRPPSDAAARAIFDRGMALLAESDRSSLSPLNPIHR